MAGHRLDDYRVGSIIQYRLFDGKTRTVVATKRRKNVKNGRPGFEGREIGVKRDVSCMSWGYDEQVTKIVKW